MLCGTRAAPDEPENTMKYMLLIYGAQPAQAPTHAEMQDEMNQYWDYEKAVAIQNSCIVCVERRPRTQAPRSK